MRIALSCLHATHLWASACVRLDVCVCVPLSAIPLLFSTFTPKFARALADCLMDKMHWNTWDSIVMTGTGLHHSECSITGFPIMGEYGKEGKERSLNPCLNWMVTILPWTHYITHNSLNPWPTLATASSTISCAMLTTSRIATNLKTNWSTSALTYQKYLEPATLQTKSDILYIHDVECTCTTDPYSTMLRLVTSHRIISYDSIPYDFVSYRTKRYGVSTIPYLPLNQLVIAVQQINEHFYSSFFRHENLILSCTQKRVENEKDNSNASLLITHREYTLLFWSSTMYNRYINQTI